MISQDLAASFVLRKVTAKNSAQFGRRVCLKQVNIATVSVVVVMVGTLTLICARQCFVLWGIVGLYA